MLIRMLRPVYTQAYNENVPHLCDTLRWCVCVMYNIFGKLEYKIFFFLKLCKYRHFNVC